MIPDDLRNEIRKEIRKIIKEELLLEFVSNKDLKKSLTTYMKSILYSEIHYLKMLESGLKKTPDGTKFIIEDRKLGNIGWIDVTEFTDEQLKEIHCQLISAKKTNTELEDFILIMRNNSDEKINWIDMVVRNKKAINSYTIFDFLYSLNPNILKLEKVEIERFLKSILVKFTKKGELFSYESIYNSFNKWKNKKNRAKNN